MNMRQFWTRRPRLRLFAGIAVISLLTLGASSPIESAVSGSDVPSITAASAQGSSYRTQRLRWPSRANQSATYRLKFKSPHLRAASMRVYGIAVPRGFAFDFIVACEHRGPAVLDWDWAQSGSHVRITVKMTTGLCDLPGPTVAGKSVLLRFRLVT
jgi:hypothetical protein